MQALTHRPKAPAPLTKGFIIQTAPRALLAASPRQVLRNEAAKSAQRRASEASRVVRQNLAIYRRLQVPGAGLGWQLLLRSALFL